MEARLIAGFFYFSKRKFNLFGMEKTDLRIVFMGTPDFAVPSLRRILTAGYQVVGVITAPDRPSGRGKKIKFSAVKQFAIDNHLRLLQPVKLKDKSFIEELKALKADLQVVVAFRMLPEQVWGMPPLGTFNLHASLLPQYRGAAPINHAIINGEKYTGLTTFFLDALIDTGKIIRQQKVQIDEQDDAGSLHDRMMLLGADLVEETIELIRRSEIKTVKQVQLMSPGIKLHPAPKIFKADCEIDWEQPIENIYNFIRGLSPYPVAYTHFISPSGDEILVRIFQTSKETHSHNKQIGQTVSDGKKELKVVVLGGFIHILELQLSGKRRMRVEEFLRGTSLEGEWNVS